MEEGLSYNWTCRAVSGRAHTPFASIGTNECGTATTRSVGAAHVGFRGGSDIEKLEHHLHLRCYFLNKSQAGEVPVVDDGGPAESGGAGRSGGPGTACLSIPHIGPDSMAMAKANKIQLKRVGTSSANPFPPWATSRIDCSMKT